MANVEILIKAIVDKAVADLKKTSGAVSDVKASTDKASVGTDKLTGALRGMAGALGVTASLAVLINAVKKFSDEALIAASRSQELTAKFNIVFGQSTPKASAELARFGQEVNRSNLELREMAADLQAVLSAMGLNRGEAADYSVELTKLAVDVAAFNNASDADVLIAFRAAMTGEYEPMKKYGVVLNEAALGAELLSMGIRGGTLAATAAEKAMARYNILMRSTTDAHGMAVREVDSFASVTKGLEGAMLDLKVAMGTALIPQVTALKQELTGLLSEIAQVQTYTNLVNEAQGYGLITNEIYASGIRGLGDKYEYTAEQLEEMIAKHKEENGLLDEGSSNVNELALAMNGLAAAEDEAAAAQVRLEVAQQSWMNSTANQVDSALKNLTLTNEQYMQGLAAVDEVFETNKVQEEEQAARIAAITEEFKKTGDVQAFTDSLGKLKDDYLPDTTEELERTRSKVAEVTEEIRILRGEVQQPIRIKIEMENGFSLDRAMP